MSISASIKDFALDLGFSAVGITTAEPFPQFTEALMSRKEQYRFFLDRPRKAPPEDPRPRAVISLAYGYMTHAFPESLLPYVGRVYLARCYTPEPQRIHGSRLKLLADYVESLGCRTIPGVFLPERWVGARAGITTFGRNNFAYLGDAGSFIVLYSIVVDTELEYDPPTLEVGCPSGCTACMRACPTQALYAPHTLDPRRCLAFNAWMTQDDNPALNPGGSANIAPELRVLMGTHVHGCDLCQEACPRNQAILKRPKPVDPFLERVAADFSLEKLLTLDDAFYAARVRPIMYNYVKKKKYFQRNAAIAMGNTRNPDHTPALRQALCHDPEELVRGYAAWALGRIGGRAGQDALWAARGDTSAFAAAEIAAALEQCATV